MVFKLAFCTFLWKELSAGTKNLLVMNNPAPWENWWKHGLSSCRVQLKFRKVCHLLELVEDSGNSFHKDPENPLEQFKDPSTTYLTPIKYILNISSRLNPEGKQYL